jgi:ferritin-like metal-binding protein YciE
MGNHTRHPSQELNPQELRRFFISHLNRIYCAKSQLVQQLPELGKHAHFLDLKQAIDETVDTVKNQIARIKQIYIKLDAWYEPESCIGLIGVLDEAFQSIGKPEDSPELRDLSILFYMQNIESIETSSFKVMMLVAQKFADPDILQMLVESYDEAREDRMLFKQITENYL